MRRRSTPKKQFAVCINNDGYEASLEAGKLYRIIPDVPARARGYLRVVDESGEGYGYDADRFFCLEVPRKLAEALNPVRSDRAVSRRE
ncbi:MAG: hypothetical protein HYR72_02635 [Deltaproteobacteria bacterium]|nr:hypothetical protein [Deltaproteobacteria bacterium]MBI3388311.1 hypothetical protein [Deltaproteobacteria bacterium]